MILLDTHVLVWLDTGSDRLGQSARERIDEAQTEGEVCVSSISFWEVAMQVHRGRVELSMSPDAWRRDLLSSGVREIPLEGDVGIAAATLEGFHGDPADRILVATAIHHGPELVTADRQILDWQGTVRRHDARK